MVTGLGATESAPFALCVASDDARAGMVGLPVPGVELKLVPVGDKLEARLRGPNITPGFWRDPERTRAAFDEEGYYRLGDALAWVDPADPSKGLVVRRPARRGLQALDRHLGERRPAARAAARVTRALRAGCRDRGARPRRSDGADLPESRDVRRAARRRSPRDPLRGASARSRARCDGKLDAGRRARSCSTSRRRSTPGR